MVNDLNAHSSVWNFYYYSRQIVTIEKNLNNQFGLLINNQLWRAIRFLS